jgi:hypothetical protein
MAKPINHPAADDEGYYVDLISDDPNVPPAAVQTHLRHLLLACELGDLVVVQCIRSIDGTSAFIVCASVVSVDNKRKLLPICELPDTAHFLTNYRPPLAAEKGFVNAQHTGKYEVCLLGNPEEVALAEVDHSSVH